MNGADFEIQAGTVNRIPLADFCANHNWDFSGEVPFINESSYQGIRIYVDGDDLVIDLTEFTGPPTNLILEIYDKNKFSKEDIHE